MRLTTCILTILFSCSFNYLPIEKLVYPEIDKNLIMLWEAAIEKDKSRCQTALNQLSNNWIEALPLIKEIKSENFNTDEFIAAFEDILPIIQSNLDTHNYTRVEELAYQLLMNFSSMRSCIGIKNYAIDNLLYMYTTYSEIHYTVHDPMLGLRNWFEFQDLINDFIEYWDSYLCTQDQEIQTYFTSLNMEMHTQLKQKLNSCLENFIQSLDSGYRIDFKIPCDEMGEAIKELISLYTESKTNI